LTIMLAELIADNPFYVLGLPTDCPAREVERAGQKLLAMLAVGLGEAKQHGSPLGPRPRTDEKVRAAMAELRDPARRLMHELFARLGASEPAAAPARLRFPGAWRAFGGGVPHGQPKER
jgi:hypothetical protein